MTLGKKLPYYTILLYFVNKSDRGAGGREWKFLHVEIGFFTGYNEPIMAGYNSKIEHGGATFLVQTQDMGAPQNCVESLVYKSGKALAPQKTTYRQFLGDPDLQEHIARIIENQHNSIIQAISEGRFDHF